MSSSSNQSLSDLLSLEDRSKALESLRVLVEGIPIRDDEGNVIGYIQKPEIKAIEFVIENTEHLIR